MKQTAKIKNWRIEKYGPLHYLSGKVTDHPRQNEFQTDVQLTTELLSIDFVNNIAVTRNTVYSLHEDGEL